MFYKYVHKGKTFKLKGIQTPVCIIQVTAGFLYVLQSKCVDTLSNIVVGSGQTAKPFVTQPRLALNSLCS